MPSCIHKTYSPQGEGQPGAEGESAGGAGLKASGRIIREMSHQKEAENESGTRNRSWAGGEISLDTDCVNHLCSTNDLRASRARQTGKGVSVGGLKALKSEKTEHEQLSEESGSARRLLRKMAFAIKVTWPL